jgi:SLT domain-containing protein
MDLVTILTVCALGFKAELFIPLGALDNCSTSFGLGATVAPRNGSAKIERWAGYITEAARRFGRPEAWVRAVMQAESRGAADATSPAGAIGLMQIMPDTYAELRARYGLGENAYDPHDNIIAGTAYMSEMIELFGVPNFLAAYNAGPARLEDHLQRGPPVARRDAAVSGANRRAAGGGTSARRTAGSPVSPLRGRCFERAEIEPADEHRQRVCAARNRRSDRRAAASTPKEKRSRERALCVEVEQSLCNPATLDQGVEQPRCRHWLRSVRSSRALSNAALG